MEERKYSFLAMESRSLKRCETEGRVMGQVHRVLSHSKASTHENDLLLKPISMPDDSFEIPLDFSITYVKLILSQLSGNNDFYLFGN